MISLLWRYWPRVRMWCAVVPLVVPISLVAFIDERQVEIADLGMRPAFDLRSGEGVFLDVTFQNLPTTAGHSVRMWALRGEGAYTEAPLGKASPWYRAARHMGRVAW